MSPSDRKICFTTLAIGSKYRQHALTLAKDIRFFGSCYAMDMVIMDETLVGKDIRLFLSIALDY
jgi:hypothetical protein